MCTGQSGEFADVAEAAEMAQAALSFLASAEVAGLPGEVLAEAVRGLGRAEAAHVAARSRLLSAFTAQEGSVADGHPTTRSWLRWQTQATQGAAADAVGWMRSLAAHPRIAAALAAAGISPSWARQLCRWTDRLPADVREDADAILLGAAAGGADLAELSGLAREMHERAAPPDRDDDGPPADEESFRDRWLRLDVHFRGAGRVEGDLTPECAAALAGVLESLGKKAGPEDDRSAGQRRHDALEEACRMLLGSGGLPDVAGQPAQMLVHATLSQLLGLMGDGGPAGPDHPASGGPDTEPGAPGTPDPPGANPASEGGAASGGAGHGASGGSGAEPGMAAAADGEGPGAADAFLRGRAAGDGEPGWLASAAAVQVYACDAKIATVVTGQVDPVAVAAAVRAWLARHDPGFANANALAMPGGHPATPPRAGPATTAPPPSRPSALEAGPPGSACPGGWGSAHASESLLAATLLRHATGMLSGPAGLAAALRTGLPGPLGAAVSLPLDITSPTATIPPHLRRAVAVRDRHCAFPGCHQVPARCQVHHVIPRSQGGATALTNLVLLCAFHHLYLIHRRGWALVLSADGTTTATSPDRHKTLHSHGPPGTAAA